MQLKVVFLAVKDAAKLLTDGAGDVLDRNIGDEIEIDFGAQSVHHGPKQRTTLGILLEFEIALINPLEIRLQNLQPVLRMKGEPIAYYASLDVVIEQHRDKRVLETRHNDKLVNERILGSAYAAEACP